VWHIKIAVKEERNFRFFCCLLWVRDKWKAVREM